jgi:hypothetical protein
VYVTPAASRTAAFTVHDPWKPVCTALLTGCSVPAPPNVLMRCDKCGLVGLSLYCRYSDCDRGWTGQVVFIPLRARAALPLHPAEVTELVLASASIYISETVDQMLGFVLTSCGNNPEPAQPYCCTWYTAATCYASMRSWTCGSLGHNPV